MCVRVRVRRKYECQHDKHPCTSVLRNKEDCMRGHGEEGQEKGGKCSEKKDSRPYFLSFCKKKKVSRKIKVRQKEDALSQGS